MTTSSIFPQNFFLKFIPQISQPPPTKMQRLAAVFSDTTSGSDHSPENSAADLFDLVKSFIERDDSEIIKPEDEDLSTEQSDGFSCDFDSELIKLQNLFSSGENQNRTHEIRFETGEALLKLAGGNSSESEGIKRKLMAHLRRKGFDAGLCKSKVQKLRSFPAGDHEYIDVNLDGNRYLIELYLAREFEIARPTRKYSSLLNTLPEIFIGNFEELKQVVKLMCSAMKESMKQRNLHVPPWRRNEFMQAKWFGSYKRITNHKGSGSEELKSSPEIIPASFVTYYCREDFGQNDGIKVGNLGAVFGGNGLLL